MSNAWAKKNPEKMTACRAKWEAANPKKLKECQRTWQNGKSKRAVQLRIQRKLRLCVWRALRGITPPDRAEELIGCSISTLRAHLQEQFSPGMTWENNTSAGWHIDHVKPCSKFNLKIPKQQKLCFHYTNTQPLWAAINRKKSNESH